MPCMPATKTKSPALAPRLHVPSALIAPAGLSVLTPFGEGACAKPRLDARAIALTQGRASRSNIGHPVISDCLHADPHQRRLKRWTAYPRQSPTQAPWVLTR